MLQRRPFNQSTAVEDRLEEEAANLRRQAKGMPPGIRCEELLRKAGQAETAARIKRGCDVGHPQVRDLCSSSQLGYSRTVLPISVAQLLNSSTVARLKSGRASALRLLQERQTNWLDIR